MRRPVHFTSPSFEILSNKLIKQFFPKPDSKIRHAITKEVNRLPKIWIRLPYIGKRGNVLIREFQNQNIMSFKSALQNHNELGYP